MKKKANKQPGRGTSWSEVSNTLQVGRGRPRGGAETGPTVLKSVRLPPAIWKELERRARAEGVAVHALVRKAILALLRSAA